MTDPMRLANNGTRAHFESVLDEAEAQRLQILREAGADVCFETNDGGHSVVIHGPESERKAMEKYPHAFAPMPVEEGVVRDSRDPAQLRLVTTDDSKAVAELTNEIETEPWKFAERFLCVVRDNALLTGRVEELERRVSNIMAWLPI